MPDVTVEDVLRGIARRAEKNLPENPTRDYATRDEIAGELGVAGDDVSREGGDPDGPLGEALAQGLVERHPEYPYWRLTEDGESRLD